MTTWINVNWEMPKMHKETYEDIDGRHEIEISDPVLVAMGDEVIIARYENDGDGGGWVEWPPASGMKSICYWTKLPTPPGRSSSNG